MVLPRGRLRPEHPSPRSLADLVNRFAPSVAWSPGSTSATTSLSQVSGVAMASGEVQPGDLFVAVPGAHHHGARFAADAAAAGAVAVLTDPAGADVVAGTQPLAVLVTDDPRDLAGPVADWVYGHPSGALTTVGITGTNGKTTTAWFVDAALRAVHPLTASLGTVELRIGDEAVESPRTTVEAPVLHGIAALAVERGATSLVTEVSSHALALGRVHGLRFDVVGFTNLQRDHLDFHGDMDGYYAAKALLFTAEQARRGVVVVDDEWGRRLAHEAQVPVQTVSTRLVDGAPAQDADWTVVSADVGLDGVGSRFVLRGPDGMRHDAFSPLPGLVNVSNAVTAIVLATAAGVPLDAAVAAVAGAHDVPGRMERVVERGQGLALGLVDYAHTPDALVLALEAVRPITPGRLVVVLGSDGDRDRGKRPIMGEIAARLADEVFVTDENPRSEDPASIRAAILSGATAVAGAIVHEVTTSRADAICQAMAAASEGDTVIVTGKGHEPTQEIAGVFYRYNDRDVLAQVLSEHRAGLPGGDGSGTDGTVRP